MVVDHNGNPGFGLSSGIAAPSFSTVDLLNRPIDLREILQKNAVLLNFFRGSW